MMPLNLNHFESLEPKASQLFEKNYRAKKRIFTRSTRPLLSFQDMHECFSIQHYSGTRTVCVEDIHGSMNRTDDFDEQFRPTQRHTENRWLRVATAFLRGIELPPIEVICAEGRYFVIDGHHRVSVARALGYGFLDAVVWDVENQCA